MNNSVVKLETGSGLAPLDEKQLMEVLKNSLYPGASDDSIKLVLGYCQASKLDVMQKPVHIVPMYVATGKKDNQGRDVKATRDVIMPGIGLYRTQASRTNSYAGISEPEFGEEITMTLDEIEVTFPKWCRITVEKLVNGEIRQFSAKEFWLENYATKSNTTTAPNAMWRRRPYAQLAKCCEAQALRKAFPDTVGSAPTAEEMEGKEFNGETIDNATGEILAGKPKVSLPQPKKVETSQEQAPKATGTVAGSVTGAPLQNAVATQGEKKFLLNKIDAAGLELTEVLAAVGIDSFENLTAHGFMVIKEHLAAIR